jgi:single-strand DNA-binding protein
MPATIQGSGNIGKDIAVKYISVGGKPRSVAEISIFVDAFKTNEKGEIVSDEKNAYWVRASIWGDRADQAARVLKKGYRVFFTGRQKISTWVDKEGISRLNVDVELESISLAIGRIESVQMKEKAERAPTPAEHFDQEAGF